MKISEIFEYAQNLGEEIDFEFTNLKGETVKCWTLDAWLGLFQLGDTKGFVTEAQWKKLTGDVFEFRVTNLKTLK